MLQHLQPNTTLQKGKYRIDRLLGQGGFGNTYAGYNTEFRETVAIKEFFIKGMAEREKNTNAVSVSNSENTKQFAEQREKFKKEARRLRQMDNSHIVKVHDLFEENGTVYYVMDYVDGENLSDRLKGMGRPLSEPEVIRIFRQLLDALKAIHNEGIWHFDLKPANIMIDRKGQVKLIDFGASKQFDVQKGGSTQSTGICYTNGYAPREQMEQNYDKCGPWTDLYALGATLYNLLTNKRPPLPSDIEDDPSADKHNALPFPPSVSDDMKDCILWMMKDHYTQRPQSVDAVIARMARWGGKIPPLPPKKKSRKWLWAGLAAAFAFGFVVVGIVAVVVLYNVFGANSDDIDLDNRERAVEFYQTGERYFYGDGVAQDYYEAVEWYEKSAALGLDSALYSLGYCYYNGVGVSLDYEEAVKWFQKAADQNYSSAQSYLGHCYYNGTGVAQNYQKAASWYKLAAGDGVISALAGYGKCCYYGNGVPQDYDAAVRWLREAADHNVAESQYLMGECYYYGYGVGQDYAEAVEWYLEAANQENMMAQYSLGFCYEKGQGVVRDYAEAAKWYRKAANQGLAVAQYSIGECYYYGNGVSKDFAEAIRWYQKAAEQGNADAQYSIGFCYEKGLGVEQDYDEALEWYQIAIANGSTDAESAIERLQ